MLLLMAQVAAASYAEVGAWLEEETMSIDDGRQPTPSAPRRTSVIEVLQDSLDWSRARMEEGDALRTKQHQEVLGVLSRMEAKLAEAPSRREWHAVAAGIVTLGTLLIGLLVFGIMVVLSWKGVDVTTAAEATHTLMGN